MAKYFQFPFATAGDKTAVPDPVQPGGSVSYTEGFGPDYELDQVAFPATAKDIPRDETNQLFFDITDFAQQVEETGILEYDALFDYQVDGYVQGSDGVLYRAETANGPTAGVVDPVGDLTGVWLPYTSDMWRWLVSFVYEVGRYVKGTDNFLYLALILNGPGTGAGVVNPVGDLTGTWALIASPASGTSRIGITTFVAGGTFNPDAAAISLRFIVTGAGGGGGGAQGNAGGQASAAASGGAAGTAIVATSTLDASYTIVVGAGGTGGLGITPTSGNTGGNSSVVGASLPIVTGNGGGGGTLSNSGTVYNAIGGSTGGAATGGDVNIEGGGAGVAVRGVTGGEGTKVFSRSVAGVSYWGGGGDQGDPDTSRAGADGEAIGSGGSGGATNDATDGNGGDGKDGIVVVEEYF